MTGLVVMLSPSPSGSRLLRDIPVRTGTQPAPASGAQRTLHLQRRLRLQGSCLCFPQQRFSQARRAATPSRPSPPGQRPSGLIPPQPRPPSHRALCSAAPEPAKAAGTRAAPAAGPSAGMEKGRECPALTAAAIPRNPVPPPWPAGRGQPRSRLLRAAGAAPPPGLAPPCPPAPAAPEPCPGTATAPPGLGACPLPQGCRNR